MSQHIQPTHSQPPNPIDTRHTELDGRSRTDITLVGRVVADLGDRLDALLEVLVVEPEGRPLRVALQDLAQDALAKLHIVAVSKLLLCELRSDYLAAPHLLD